MQKRVTIRRHKYFYKPIDGTPFSLGIALPEGYGMFEFRAEEEIKHSYYNGEYYNISSKENSFFFLLETDANDTEILFSVANSDGLFQGWRLEGAPRLGVLRVPLRLGALVLIARGASTPLPGAHKATSLEVDVAQTQKSKPAS